MKALAGALDSGPEDAAFTTGADGDTLLFGVSCPSTKLCASVDYSGNVVTSANPAGGASAWKVTHVDEYSPYLLGASCPSTALCVAVDDTGRVFTSTNPAGARSARR